MELARDRDQSLNVKRNRKSRTIKEPPQVSILVNGNWSLAHNHQHLHRLGSQKGTEWLTALKIPAIGVGDDP